MYFLLQYLKSKVVNGIRGIQVMVEGCIGSVLNMMMITMIPNFPRFPLRLGSTLWRLVRGLEVQQGYLHLFHASVSKGGGRDKSSGLWGGGVAGVMVTLHGKCWATEGAHESWKRKSMTLREFSKCWLRLEGQNRQGVKLVWRSWLLD